MPKGLAGMVIRWPGNDEVFGSFTAVDFDVVRGVQDVLQRSARDQEPFCRHRLPSFASRRLVKRCGWYEG